MNIEKIEKNIKQQLKKVKKEELLKQAHDLGFLYEKTRMGCSQCVVYALGKILGFN